MALNNDKIEKIYQFAVLVAAESDDYFDSRLGPIHLLKYLYLADLCHARRYGGESFSGVEWIFHNFGPWSLSAFEKIEPSLTQIYVDINEIESKWGEKEFKRYYKKDDFLLRDISRSLPSHLTLELKKQIKKHGADTTSLLHDVYTTEPMLNAAPGDILSLDVTSDLITTNAIDKPVLIESNLTNKAQKRLKEKLAIAKVNRKKVVSNLIDPSPNPRYDNVFFEGVKELNSLSTPEFTEGKIEVRFDNSVWKSGARKSYYD